MYRIITVLSIILLTGCVSASNLPESQEGKVPKGQDVVYVDAGFEALFDELAGRGFPMDTYDADRGIISTGWNDVGESTMINVQATVKDGTITLRGKWNVDASMSAALGASLGAASSTTGQKAEYTSGRSSRAFAELVTIALALGEPRYAH